MSAQIIDLIQPAYRVHREVAIEVSDLPAAIKELKALLRKAPYAMGAPAPTGSLTLSLGEYALRFSLMVYSHSAFYGWEPLAVEKAIASLLEYRIPPALHPLLNEIFSFLHQRGYPLTQHWKDRPRRGDDRRTWNWIYRPGRGFEYPEMTLIHYTHHAQEMPSPLCL